MIRRLVGRRLPVAFRASAEAVESSELLLYFHTHVQLDLVSVLERGKCSSLEALDAA